MGTRNKYKIRLTLFYRKKGQILRGYNAKSIKKNKIVNGKVYLGYKQFD